MARASYEQMVKTSQNMFRELGIDQTFEPFFGYTYNTEGQKRILFVTFDEWSYINGADSYTPQTGYKRETTEENDSMNVKRLFRASPYYRDINKVFKAIKSSMTAEDVAFYNFVVRPSNWEEYHKNKEFKYLDESIRAFEAVIYFCNPDLIVFCDFYDYFKIDKAMNSTLKAFLSERGIEWLESGNLNYDINSVPRGTIPLKAKSISNIGIVEELDKIIPFEYYEKYKKIRDYDNIELHLQSNNPVGTKYKMLPDSLQILAYFIDCEIKSPGSFSRQRLLNVISDLEQEMRSNYFKLMEEYIEPIIDSGEVDEYFKNPLCTFIKPKMFYSWQLLSAIRRSLTASLARDSVSKRKFCGSHSTKKKSTSLRNNVDPRVSSNKEKKIKELKVQEKVNPYAKCFTKDRWRKIRARNQEKYSQSIIAQTMEKEEKRKIQKLLSKVGTEGLTPDEEAYINKRRRLIGLPAIDEDNREYYKKAYVEQQRILNFIRSNRQITLEELADKSSINEYHLSRLLKEWNIKENEGRWEGKILDKRA